MSRSPFLGFVALCMPALAFAEPISETLTLGEMYGHSAGYTGNAYTAPKGGIFIHPFLRGAMGVHEMMDVKAGLGMLLGPNASIEIAPVQTASTAFSIEPGITGSWDFKTLGYTTAVHFSEVSGTGMINLTVVVAGGYGTIPDLDGGPGTQFSNPLSVLRPEIGYDFTLSERSKIVTTLRSNLINLINGNATGTVGAYWFYGYGSVGGSLGVNVSALEVTNQQRNLLDDVDLILPSFLVAPLPHAQIWFRL